MSSISTPGSTYSTPTPNSNKKNNQTWLYVVIALLVGLCIYLFIGKNNAVNERDLAYANMDSLDNSQDQIREDFNAALARLDLLVSENAGLDSLVKDQNSEIGKLRNEIQGLLRKNKLSAQDSEKARSLINQLKSKVKDYEERIATLEYENMNLNSSVDSLSSLNSSTMTDNAALRSKVAQGALLALTNIRMEPIELKRDGKKEKITGKAKKVDFLRILFDIEQNRLAEDAVNELHFVIFDPSGKLLSNVAYGSGITRDASGQEFNYTLSKRVSIRKEEKTKDVAVDWYQESAYEKGEYKISIYNNGYKIGEGITRLK